MTDLPKNIHAVTQNLRKLLAACDRIKDPEDKLMMAKEVRDVSISIETLATTLANFFEGLKNTTQ